jgi:predicted negative regulator of RcsB-dependent stress response
METEEEQVEKLKDWLKENGLSIVFGIVIGVGGIAGYKYWVQVQETTAAKASDHFTQMIDALSADNGEGLQEQADMLIAEHASTDYGLMAQLTLARQHVANAEFDQAEAALQQVVGSAGQRPLVYVARTRLAAVQLQTGQYDQALTTLAVEFPDEFAAIANELRGDILALQGKDCEAVDAYRKAQSSVPTPANVEFLQRKLNDLGSTS